MADKKKFILSDLHIGHEQSQYPVMEQAIQYIRDNARSGDEIWGLGDWFHILENGLDTCMDHPITKKFRDLSAEFPTKLVPGNHDHELEKYRDNPALGNPISPISLVKPFSDDNIWYCHGHEYDPTIEYLPSQFIWLWNKLHPRVTPSRLKGLNITERYLIAVYLVYLRASIGLKNKSQKEGHNYKGIVLGHTHLPFHQESPELPFLFDDGDMRHSGTFAIKDEAGFQLLQWDFKKTGWNITRIKTP
jgi:UDP-2,3-diacylglucosamine pyrophosphatase LpxH